MGRSEKAQKPELILGKPAYCTLDGHAVLRETEYRPHGVESHVITQGGASRLHMKPHLNLKTLVLVRY